MKKILTKFFLLSFFLLNLTFMAESKNQSLRIAAILPLSGDYEEIGKKILKTFELTIFELSNANISLLPFDNKSTKSGTKFAFQELQNQKIDIVIGPVFMENLLSIANEENFSKYIFISLSNNNITLPKNVISFGINIDSQITALKLILNEKKTKIFFSDNSLF
jgi:outer membrane PBP1 activator LpoA protein